MDLKARKKKKRKEEREAKVQPAEAEKGPMWFGRKRPADPETSSEDEESSTEDEPAKAKAAGSKAAEKPEKKEKKQGKEKKKKKEKADRGPFGTGPKRTYGQMEATSISSEDEEEDETHFRAVFAANRSSCSWWNTRRKTRGDWQAGCCKRWSYC